MRKNPTKATPPVRETVTFGAHEFWKVEPPGGSDGELLLIPRRTIDSRMEFPGKASLDGVGPWISSGVAVHTVGRDRGDIPMRMHRPWVADDPDPFDIEKEAHDQRPSIVNTTFRQDDGPAKAVAASNLVVFNEIDFYGECHQVLEAHNWWDGGEPTYSLKEQVEEIVGTKRLQEARDLLTQRDHYDLYVLEQAATFIAPPLSRLWYAASMMVLYYLHNDDMRLGYLWAEYQIKLRFELFALKHMEIAERNRENGKKGGLKEQAEERLEVLDRLAKERFKDFAFASDPHARRLAKQIAQEYDRGAEAKLFTLRGRLLSDRWFDEWVTHFRQVARGQE